MPDNGEQRSQHPGGSCADPVGTQRLAELAAQAGSGQDRAGGHAGPRSLLPDGGRTGDAGRGGPPRGACLLSPWGPARQEAPSEQERGCGNI